MFPRDINVKIIIKVLSSHTQQHDERTAFHKIKFIIFHLRTWELPVPSL